MNTIMILDNPDHNEFIQNYGKKSVPVLIKGVSNHWKAQNKWTEEFFTRNYGDMEVKVARSYNKQDKKKIKLRDYFEYMENNDDSDPYYLTDWQFHLTHKEILGDYDVPTYFMNWLDQLEKNMRVFYSWFYIGPKGSASKMHVDVNFTSAWNAVISGKKRWLFYAPDQEPLLYKGKVDGFKPNYKKFPEFQKACPIYAEQNPGEMIFTPSGWWHQVENISDCISITENFVNESNYLFIATQLEKFHMEKELSILKQLAERNL